MSKKTFALSAVERARRAIKRAKPPREPRLTAEQVIIDELSADLLAKQSEGWSWTDMSRWLAGYEIDIAPDTIRRYLTARDDDKADDTAADLDSKVVELAPPAREAAPPKPAAKPAGSKPHGASRNAETL